MRRELKANLIFFGILIPLLVPGFIILMNKKLSGTTEPNYMPEALPSSVAYMQPPPIPPGLPRLEPPKVRQWVNELMTTRVPATAGSMRTQEGGPVMGDAARTQLLWTGPRGIALLVWDKRDLSEKTTTVNVIGESTMTSQSVGLHRIEVPRIEVRRPLQSVGYVNPPFTVSFVMAYFNADLPDRPAKIVVNLEGLPAETIALPALDAPATSPAAAAPPAPK